MPPELFLLGQICTKSFVGWGFAPDPTAGAYSAPPDSLAGLRGPTSKGGEGRGVLPLDLNSGDATARPILSIQSSVMLNPTEPYYKKIQEKSAKIQKKSSNTYCVHCTTTNRCGGKVTASISAGNCSSTVMQYTVSVAEYPYDLHMPIQI